MFHFVPNRTIHCFPNNHSILLWISKGTNWQSCDVGRVESHQHKSCPNNRSRYKLKILYLCMC